MEDNMKMLNENKKIKIGIDVDEVLANHLEKLNEFYYKKTGKKYKERDYHTYNWWEVWDITKEQAIEIDKEFKKSNLFKEILPIEGAIHSLRLLKMKNELFIITSRPNETKELTLNWFFNHFNINIPIIHSGDFWGEKKSKSDICKEIGIKIMVEDHPKYALECAQKGIKVFLLNKPWNKNYQEHENIIKVRNWGEILERLKKKKEEKEENIIEKVRKFVEEECNKPTSKYGHEPYENHFVWVVKYAKQLAKELNADEELVEIAAWLHDIGSIVHGRESHHVIGADIAEKKLKELNYPLEKIGLVKKCILNHRGSREDKRESVEERIIAEADSLAQFDNLEGIFMAAFLYENKNQKEARKATLKKINNKWNQLSDRGKEIVKPKWEAINLLLK